MKGKKTGGRKKGTPNKVTGDVREAFKALLEGRAGDLDRWLRETAEGYPWEERTEKTLPDGTVEVRVSRGSTRAPDRALELFTRVAEFCLPKLARTEHADANGAPLEGLTLIIERKTESGQP